MKKDVQRTNKTYGPSKKWKFMTSISDLVKGHTTETTLLRA